MKLLIARSNFYSYSETFIDQQIKQLSPAAVLYEGWQPTRIYGGGSIYPFPLDRLMIRGTLRNLFPTVYQKIYTYFLSRFLVRQKIDFLLANYGPLGTQIFLACQKAHIPFAVHFHGFDASETKTIAHYGEAYRTILPLAKAVIVVSEAMKSNIEKMCGPLKSLHVVPYGVDLEKFKPLAQANELINSNESTTQTRFAPFKLIAVGRFTAKKAPIHSIKSFEILLKSCPSATFTMIGDGELWEDAKMYVKNQGLKQQVIFMGQQSPEVILQTLQQSDAFIQHSVLTPSGDSEGTPNTILEASACGLPIISTLHAGIPEAVIHGKTGFLVKEHDIEGMGQALIQLASNPSICKKMGSDARKHMLAHYELAQQAQKLKNLFN